MASKDTIIYSEKKLEKLLCEGVKYLGGVCYKFLSSQSKGNPDRIVIVAGCVVFVEVKTTGCKPTALQLIKMGEIKAAGGDCRVIDCYDDLMVLLLTLLNGAVRLDGTIIDYKKVDCEKFDKLISKLRHG